MRELHDGRQDGLVPLESLDVRSANSFAEMLQAMSKTAFGGRALGEALGVLHAMDEDPDCAIVVTISGAMTIAKMGRVLCDMIEADLAQIVISTGAIMAHGLSEAIGGLHYKHEPHISDRQLYEWGYNRVYDTIETEENLCENEAVMRQVLDGLDWSRPTCSHRITRAIGQYLLDHDQMPSILGWACRKDVPVYVPAFTDSELGLDLATYALGRHRAEHGPDADLFAAAPPPFNPFLDLFDYARRIAGVRTLGIVTIGGGVPRNWAQQIGPYFDLMQMRVGSELPVPRFKYGVRICPEPVHWGGLSGCTYTEGVSWGKFVSPADGGRFAEVYCDATIAWPLLVRAALESRDDCPREA
ncbi:MAG: deoxyhypusine synthase family protein [Candidatus Brocadiaceae bacterium]|nr:deoxyhypusine synthase family protein [Candidatus Brocadiaceae bacterium]